MSGESLTEPVDCVVGVAHSPGAHIFDDFVIFNGPCRVALGQQVVRGTWTLLCRR